MTWPFPDTPIGRPPKHPEHYLVDENGCWVWQRAKTTADGYGHLQVDGRHVCAHVYAYELLRGPIPAGMDLDHVVCDRRDCANPFHTEPATRAQNARRGRKTRLTADQVRQIRATARADGLRATARRLGVSYGTVSSIMRGDTWKEVA